MRFRLPAAIILTVGLAAIATVVADGARAVARVTRPFDLDQYRDIAAAQSIADGHLLRDPFYRGETIWYNPLLPLAVAAASRLTGMDVPIAFVQAGPWLNALAPLACFLTVAALFGVRPALLALVLLVYAPPHGDPVWSTPTPSPWLFPSTFSTAFFYASLALLRAAAARHRWQWWVASGCALGVTFLAHTMPALILGACAVVSIGVATRNRPRTSRSRLAGLSLACAAVFGAALLVASPFLWSIAYRYHLHVLNPAPGTWRWTALDLNRFPDLARSWATPFTLPVLIGALVIARRARRQLAAQLLVCWFLVALGFFGYGYLQQMHPGLPAFLPQFHAYLYLRSLGCVLGGIGLSVVLTAVTRVTRVRRARTVATVLTLMVASIIVGVELPAYHARDAFRRDRSIAMARGSEQASSAILARIRAETPPDAVILATVDDSITAVAPAGRTTVAVPPEFSNPYIETDVRREDQRHMMYAVKHQGFDRLPEMMRLYGVTHILVAEQAPGEVVGHDLPPGVTLVSWQPDMSLYAYAPKASGTR